MNEPLSSPYAPLVEYWIGREVGVTASSFGLLCNWIRSRNTRVSQASKRSEPRCAASLRVIPRPTKRTSEGNEQCPPPNLSIHFGQKNAAVKETFMFSSHLRPRSVRQSSSIYKFASGKFMRHLRWLHDHARQRANLDNLDKNWKALSPKRHAVYKRLPRGFHVKWERDYLSTAELVSGRCTCEGVDWHAIKIPCRLFSCT